MKILKLSAISCILLASSCYAKSEQPYQMFGESNEDYSRWTIYAHNIPVKEVEVQIHCKGAIFVRQVDNDGDNVLTATCENGAK